MDVVRAVALCGRVSRSSRRRGKQRTKPPARAEGSGLYRPVMRRGLDRNRGVVLVFHEDPEQDLALVGSETAQPFLHPRGAFAKLQNFGHLGCRIVRFRLSTVALRKEWTDSAALGAQPHQRLVRHDAVQPGGKAGFPPEAGNVAQGFFERGLDHVFRSEGIPREALCGTPEFRSE